MRSTVLSLVVVMIVVTGLLAACAPQATEPPKPQPTTPPTAAAAPASDGAALLSDRCTVCHNLDRVKSAKKTSEQWAQTVSRMVGKGAKVNADEQKALVAYLAKTYAP
jgi:cytochrome c5